MQQDLKMGVSHVMLGVRDLATALAFYRDKLRLGVKFEIPGFAFLDGGGVTLALSEPLSKGGDAPTGGFEIVLGVEGVRKSYDTLSDRGITFLNEPRIVDGSNWAANFNDPDGHLLSIYGPE